MQNIFFIVISLVFISCSQSIEKKIEEPKKSEKIDQLALLESEYKVIDTVHYLEEYIEKVIINGSSGLGFASGNMQGGFAHISDVKKIAHFVVALSGKSCTDHDMVADAQMYYTSNCGGCHGDDGKGQNGLFPDLTKPTLLGILKRKEFLEHEISKLQK